MGTLPQHTGFCLYEVTDSEPTAQQEFLMLLFCLKSVRLNFCTSVSLNVSHAQRAFSLMHYVPLQPAEAASRALPSLCSRNWKLFTIGCNGYFTPTPAAQTEAIDKIFFRHYRELSLMAQL